MLNRKICWKCYEKYTKSHSVLNDKDGFMDMWYVFDTCMCPKAPSCEWMYTGIQIKREPPEECPYLLEHLLYQPNKIRLMVERLWASWTC